MTPVDIRYLSNVELTAYRQFLKQRIDEYRTSPSLVTGALQKHMADRQTVMDIDAEFENRKKLAGG